MHTNHIPFGRVKASGSSSGITPGEAPVKLHACIDTAIPIPSVTVPGQDPVIRRDSEIPARVDKAVARLVKAEAAGDSGQKKPDVLHIDGSLGGGDLCEEG